MSLPDMNRPIILPQGEIAPPLDADNVAANQYLEAARTARRDYPTANRTRVGYSAGRNAVQLAQLCFEELSRELPENLSEEIEAADTWATSQRDRYTLSTNSLTATLKYGAQEIGAVSARSDKLDAFEYAEEDLQFMVLKQLLFDAVSYARIAKVAVPVAQIYAPIKNIASSSPARSIQEMATNPDLQLRWRGHYSGGWLSLEKILGN